VRCAYPLRPRLPNVQSGADRATQGNLRRGKLIREHLRGLLMQRREQCCLLQCEMEKNWAITGDPQFATTRKLPLA